MKCVIIVAYILFLLIYGYSAYMTSVDPGNNLWGYLCTLIFGILTILSINLYSKHVESSKKDSEEI
jgi:hypothetical protein